MASDTELAGSLGGPAQDTARMSTEEEPAGAVADKKGRPAYRLVLMMFALCLATFLVALDVTIITTALPSISEHFDSAAGFTWIGSSYLLAQAASTLVWGKFSDVFGRKPCLLAANALFLLGSLLAALSVTVGMLIVGRTVQGIGGGGLIVLSNICVGDLFSPRSRGIFYGLISGVWAVANSLGPVMGGAFTQRLTWRWCFWINLPLSSIALVITFLFLDLKTPKTPFMAGMKSIDWLGTLLVVGGTLMFLFGLEYGGVTFPWRSVTVVCLLLFGVITLALFVLCEIYVAASPIMPRRLLAHRATLATLAACAIHAYVFISGSFYIPFYFQASKGLSPLMSGVYLLALAGSLSAASISTGLFISKTGDYTWPILTGFMFMTLGWGLFIDLGATTGLAKLIVYQVIAGIGVGANIQAPMIALQANASPKDIAAATSLYGFVRNLATSVSIVVGGVIYQKELLRIATANPVLAPIVDAGHTAGPGNTVGIVASLRGSARDQAEAAFARSLRPAWIMYTVVAALGIVAWFFIPKKTLSHEHEETKTGLEAEKERREEVARERAQANAAPSVSEKAV